jgi:hypothetical protein
MFPLRIEGLDPKSGQWVLIAERFNRITAHRVFSKAVRSRRWKEVRVIAVLNFWRAAD